MAGGEALGDEARLKKGRREGAVVEGGWGDGIDQWGLEFDFEALN